MNVSKRIFILPLFLLIWLAACAAEPSVSPISLSPTASPPESTPSEPVVGQPTKLPTAEPTATITIAATATKSATERPPATPTPPTFTTHQITIDGETVENCQALTRPALLFRDTHFFSPDYATYLLHDLTDGRLCRLTLASQPHGQQITAVDDLLYYVVYDWDEANYTIWQDDGLGQGHPLPFTQISVKEVNSTNFNFLVADEGRTLTWSLFEYQSGDIPTVRNRLWLSDSDGQNLRQLRDQQTESAAAIHYKPIRFTDDGHLLYAHQPLGLGGGWDRFHGRYQSLYQLDLQGGQPDLIFDCQNLLCLGDISADGRYLAYTDNTTGQIQLITWEGDSVQTIIPPGIDYLGYPTFAPDGRLFFTSADLDDTYNAAPGYLSVLTPPYADSAETYYQEANITTINQINGDYLLYWHNFDPALINLNNPFDIFQYPGIQLQAVLP